MNQNPKKINLRELADKAIAKLSVVRRYSVALFVVFITVLYAFSLYRIESLNSIQPTQSDITSKVQAAQIPYISPLVLSQLKSLQDNSVSVQALFNRASSNPFQ